MGIMDFANNASSLTAAQDAARGAPLSGAQQGSTRVINGRRRRVGADGQPLPEAKIWINVGRYVQTDEGPVFVSLPYGIPLDQMNDIDTSGTNEENVALRRARNKLKADLLEMAMQRIQPGETVSTQLSVEIRHRADDLQISDADNQFAAPIEDLF